MKTIKAITIWQPWASAIALGVKHIETRGWSTNYRGPILIHAAKRKLDRHAQAFADYEHTMNRLPARVPLGAIVAMATLVRVQPTEQLDLIISAIERSYGDYSPGRFGWVLENIRPFKEPIGYTGRQGLFDVPLEVVEGQL